MKEANINAILAFMEFKEERENGDGVGGREILIFHQHHNLLPLLFSYSSFPIFIYLDFVGRILSRIPPLRVLLVVTSKSSRVGTWEFNLGWMR